MLASNQCVTYYFILSLLPSCISVGSDCLKSELLCLSFIMQYGEVDIDGSLVAAKAAGAEEIMMLNNGCLCCTVRGDLVRMIAELVSRKKGKFDHIVIETTGKKLMKHIVLD